MAGDFARFLAAEAELAEFDKRHGVITRTMGSMGDPLEVVLAVRAKLDAEALAFDEVDDDVS